MMCLLLFWEFAKIGLVCVGGGYASMPLIQAVVVDAYHWLTLSEFIDIFTISQMTPGPIGINAATFAGMKIAGLFGAVSATLGFVFPSFVLCLFIARLFFRYGSIGVIRGALNGLRPAVVALICAAGLSFIALSVFGTETFPKEISTLQKNFDPKSALILVLALFATQKKANVIHILLASGVLGIALGMTG
ncbi:MAG: chromate transporter [Schwartzia sp.]|nr:chromate transporter [Schwartzia sp. (in: firmicutes)]